MEQTCNTPFALQEFQDVSNWILDGDDEDILPMSFIEHEIFLERAMKKIYSPIYRLDSYRSMPLDEAISMCKKPAYLHSMSVGTLFIERKKPRLRFSETITILN